MMAKNSQCLWTPKDTAEFKATCNRLVRLNPWSYKFKYCPYCGGRLMVRISDDSPAEEPDAKRG
jgi:rRNA maturation endonuclease Nob1